MSNIKTIIHGLLVAFLITFTFSGCAHKSPPIDIPDIPPPAPEIKDIDVALVLGGGGSKGLAHVGVLEVLEREGVPINLIVGTSSGSLIGALYADNPNAQSTKTKIIDLNKWSLLDISILSLLQSPIQPKGPVEGHSLRNFIFKNIKTQNIEKLKIPLVVATTDVHKNEIYLIKSGPIAPAVHASAAIPPFFSPVSLYGHTLIDGGIIEPVPVESTQQFKPKLIIAVNIAAPPPTDAIFNMPSLTYRSLYISYYEMCRLQSNLADIAIHPDLSGCGMFDDNMNEHIYKQGRIAATNAMHAIKTKMQELGIPIKH